MDRALDSKSSMETPIAANRAAESRRPSVSIDRYLQARWTGPLISSYAQNAEDVRLWRVFSETTGFYIDVGAGHPVVDSVTKIFYDAGWCGINIEPGPRFRELSAERPRDVNLEVAIAERPGTFPFWVLLHDPDRSSLLEPNYQQPDGGKAEQRNVGTVRLDQLIHEHGASRPIDFLKIDAEGGERGVLASFDPSLIRPTVLVVEAIAALQNEPSHDGWEPTLLDAGYLLAGFDGVNRFYVPEEHGHLVDALSYPISILDRYVRHDRERKAEDPVDRARLEVLERAAEDVQREVDELRGTLSWRITKPLRIVRRTQRQGIRTAVRGTSARSVPVLGKAVGREFETAIARRLDQVLDAVSLRGSAEHTTEGSLSSALDRLERLASTSSPPCEVLSWLALTGVSGSYPNPGEVASLARLLRTSGSRQFVTAIEERAMAEVASASATTTQVDVLVGEVIVDATQIVTTDLHSGIQRVARELISHWISDRRPLRLAAFDSRIGALKLLDDSESHRITDWRNHLAESEAHVAMRAPAEATGNPVVPFECRVLVLEIPEPSRCVGLRSLTTSLSIASLGMVCYDLIPIVASDTATKGVFETFYDYLPLVKRAGRISAISQQSADSFDRFASLLDATGERRPKVVSHPLPTTQATITHADLADARTSLRLHGLSLILVVGISDERKNHVSVVEAALRLCRKGLRFELLFITGSQHSDAPEFDSYARYAREQGVELQVKRRATEAELWAAYRLARFTVFPSLVEGFGLPVAESLVCGTPAITSCYGAMAEVAAGGGTLTVDPRNIDDLEEQMRRLLTDDELLERLRKEASSRDFGSWDRYADDVWNFLIDEEHDTAP